MQNAQNTRQEARRSRPIRALLAFAALLAIVLAVFPGQALAKSYSMPQVDIRAELQSNGTLHVVETRTFDFDGSFTAVWWEQGSLPEFGAYRVNDVKIGLPDAAAGGGASLVDVEEVPFDTSWRSAGGPGTTAYSVDQERTTCYLFFSAEDTQMVAQIDYEIANAVTVYADCAELYWKYVADEWGEDSRDVSCTIALPVPAGAAPQAGQDVRAWGHGPLDGSLSFSDDAASVTYTVPRVEAGEFAEARVVVPATWLSAASSQVLQAHAAARELDKIVAEEQQWADQANRQRDRGRLGILGLLVAGLGSVGWGLRNFLRYGREHKPTQNIDYWSEEPDAGAHPAVISRLWEFNDKRERQLSATIMHLINEGAMRIRRGAYEVPGDKKHGSHMQEDYYLVLDRSYAPATVLDKATLDLLFQKVAKGTDQVWIDSVRTWAEDDPAMCEGYMRDWHSKLDKMVDERDYFEPKGFKVRGVMYAFAGALGAMALGGAMGFGNLLFLVLLAPAIALLPLAHFSPRRTQRGADVQERCEALKRWMTERSVAEERPDAGSHTWGTYLVYAYVFGVADKALERFRQDSPEMFEQEEAQAVHDNGYVPLHHLYGNSHSSVGASVASALERATLAVSSATTPSSDGDGGGGGFSGGGGGGFGGGGGGGGGGAR